MNYVALIFDQSGRFLGYDNALYSNPKEAEQAAVDLVNRTTVPNVAIKILCVLDQEGRSS